MSDELDGSEYSEMYVWERQTEENSQYKYCFTRANERSLVFVVNGTGQQFSDLQCKY